MILSICDTPKVMEVMNIVNIIITIIRIVVPIILLFSLTFKLVNASTKNDEDAIASIKKKAVPSIIAAALIFIVPVLVNLIVSISFPNSEYTKCIANISNNTIQEIYVNKAEKLVSKAEETLNINDYVNAKNYIHNVKDNSKRESYEERLAAVKAQIDDSRKESEFGKNTGYGKELVVNDEVKEACNYIFNSDDTMIRLYRCPCTVGERKYNCMYTSALPGGGNKITRHGMGRGDPPYETEEAKETISFTRYMMGAFTYEQPGSIEQPSTYEFAKVFILLFKGDFLTDYRFKTNSRGEIEFPIGTCTQCYSDANMKEKYDNGKYTDVMDEIYRETKFLLLVDDDGSMTNTEYAGLKENGVTYFMTKWSREGDDMETIVRKSRVATENQNFKAYYSKTNLYDCRNLLEE